MSKKYILVSADTNDADYVHLFQPITDEDIEALRPMMKALEENNGDFRTTEFRRSKELSPEERYRNVEGFELFRDEFVPYGEYGVHTIDFVKIVNVEETLYDR